MNKIEELEQNIKEANNSIQYTKEHIKEVKKQIKEVKEEKRKKEIVNITEKKCSKCGEIKDVETNFYFFKHSSYFDNYCRDCRANYNKEAYHRDPEASRERVRKYRLKNPGAAKESLIKSRSIKYKINKIEDHND